ncbi:hypothetical protein ACW7DJ_00355 (plasmid) [Mammaliicoccus sciuri]|nr:hypothetical protein [Mammaliicoccus sciuri]
MAKVIKNDHSQAITVNKQAMASRINILNQDFLLKLFVKNG